MMEILEDGPAYVNYGYHESDWEKNGELTVLRNFLKPDMTVFDVGANNGEWTMNALKIAPCKVHAFEPARMPYSELVRNTYELLYRNSVVPVNVGIGEFHRVRTLYVSVPKNAATQPHASHASSVFESNVQQHPDVDYMEQRDTEFITLDSYADFHTKHIHYLKIDTEGMELEVLRGAERTLRDGKVSLIQFEYGSKYGNWATLKAIFELLQPHGFMLHRIVPVGLLRTPVWHHGLECGRFSNYLAVRKDVVA